MNCGVLEGFRSAFRQSDGALSREYANVLVEITDAIILALMRF
jgi:hypothetical protein